MERISVIIPAFKRIEQTGKTIDLLIKSRGNGSEYELEVVVADSTSDRSLEEALQHAFPTIVYTRPKKSGIAANKNQGARVATANILIFCDSDMDVEPDTLSNTLRCLKSHQTGAIVGGQVIWKGGPRDGQQDRPRPEDRRKHVETTTYIEALYSRFVATYKDVFWQVGGYDEDVFNLRGEGADLSIRYWRAGFPLVYHESILVHHVHDAPQSAALRVRHPEWGVAKDLLLLGYKYGMFDAEYDNFKDTIVANFQSLGEESSYRLLEGIGKQFDFITEVKEALDTFRRQDSPRYDFKFLEVFSDVPLFSACITTAAERIQQAIRGK